MENVIYKNKESGTFIQVGFDALSSTGYSASQARTTMEDAAKAVVSTEISAAELDMNYDRVGVVADFVKPAPIEGENTIPVNVEAPANFVPAPAEVVAETPAEAVAEAPAEVVAETPAEVKVEA